MVDSLTLNNGCASASRPFSTIQKGMKLRSGENPALWRGNLEHMLPKANRTSREHHPAAGGQLPALMAELKLECR